MIVGGLWDGVTGVTIDQTTRHQPGPQAGTLQTCSCNRRLCSRDMAWNPSAESPWTGSSTRSTRSEELVGTWRDRNGREARLAALEAFRLVRRKAADEDVTRFGEELAQLHVDTLTTTARRRGRARTTSARSTPTSRPRRSSRPASTAAEVTEVTRTLADGRFAAGLRAGRPRRRPAPARREPCFFNPAHGPADHDVEWAPPGGVPRDVPVCFRDFERLTAGEQPEIRLVRLGNRRVRGSPPARCTPRGRRAGTATCSTTTGWRPTG